MTLTPEEREEVKRQAIAMQQEWERNNTPAARAYRLRTREEHDRELQNSRPKRPKAA